jgi:Zn-dependent protease
LPIFAAAKPVPFNPYAVRYGKWGAALVAVAGPITNFLIAFVCAMTLRIAPHGLLASEFLRSIIFVNLSLFIFNLIPFPPLDGSRVLYAVAPEGLRNFMDRIEKAGIVVIFAILFFGFSFISPLLSIALGFFNNLLLPSSFPGL